MSKKEPRRSYCLPNITYNELWKKYVVIAVKCGKLVGYENLDSVL